MAADDRESEEDISSAEEGGEEDDEMSQKLALFQEITGINDTSRCRTILEAHQWNVETAVQDALNEQEGIRPVFNQPPPPQNPSFSTHPRPTLSPPPLVGQHQYMLPRQHQQRVGWIQWLLGWGFLPIRWVLSITNELYQTLVTLIFGSQPSLPSDPTGDVQRFVSQYEQDYGTDHPEFLQCSYGEAIENAKKELQFLLIYLHSAGHRDTPTFCREVMSSQLFKDILALHSCLLWGVGVDSEEGARVSHILRESTYPFLALVVLRGSRMTVVQRIEGYGTVDTVIDTLQQSMRQNEPELVVLRAERHQRSMDQILREQQEEEFQRSLTADREKDRRREEELDKEAKRAAAERQREEERRLLVENFERERKFRVARLPPEPTSNDEIVQISIKMPNGDRIGRSFKSTDKLQSLYDFAYTYEDLPKLFTIFTSYPKKELVCDQDGGPSLAELNFAKKVLVFVQSTSDDYDDDEDDDL